MKNFLLSINRYKALSVVLVLVNLTLCYLIFSLSNDISVLRIELENSKNVLDSALQNFNLNDSKDIDENETNLLKKYNWKKISILAFSSLFLSMYFFLDVPSEIIDPKLLKHFINWGLSLFFKKSTAFSDNSNDSDGNDIEFPNTSQTD